MKLFVVIQRGVYRHGIVGVFDDLELAISNAKRACKEESDNYHNFEIVALETNSYKEEVVLKNVARKGNEVLLFEGNDRWW